MRNIAFFIIFIPLAVMSDFKCSEMCNCKCKYDIHNDQYFVEVDGNEISTPNCTFPPADYVRSWNTNLPHYRFAPYIILLENCSEHLSLYSRFPWTSGTLFKSLCEGMVSNANQLYGIVRGNAERYVNICAKQLFFEIFPL
jgi:hypothetical protein